MGQASKGRREKLFGAGRPVPLDREAKLRIATRLRALKRRTVKGKHYGRITGKAVDVALTLLWTFHNAIDGRCFPSYERIAEAAGCCRDTVCEAIKALEACGILTWCNRLVRVVEDGIRRVHRTSNAYRFRDLGSKSEIPPGTTNQGSERASSLCVEGAERQQGGLSRGEWGSTVPRPGGKVRDDVSGGSA